MMPTPPSRPTRIECELVAGRARFSVLDQGTYLAPRPVHVASSTLFSDSPRVHLRVALIGISMMLLAHDDVVVDVRVGPGVVLEVVEPAGLVAYDAGGEPSRWTLRAAVGEGGSLVWDGAPFVAAAGSNVIRLTDVALAAGARALLREILVLGRSGDGGGQLRNVTHLRDDAVGADGAMDYLVEDLDLTGVARRAVGVLGASKVMASVTAVGWRPLADRASSAGVTLQLAREGSVQRALSGAAHQVDAPLAATFAAWRRDLLDGVFADRNP